MSNWIVSYTSCGTIMDILWFWKLPFLLVFCFAANHFSPFLSFLEVAERIFNLKMIHYR